MPPTNHVALIKVPKGPLIVEEAPYTAPGPHELVIKTAAMAINPVDVYKQIMGDDLLPHMAMPCVLGQDVAGTVVEVGSSITRFAPGDRVVGETAGTVEFGNRAAEGGFQTYVILRVQVVAAVPSSISFARASVIPLCFSTAVFGLFHPFCLALNLPSLLDPPPNTEEKEKGALLITSGASSVGANAIQLAVAAGYSVYTTASPKNFDFVRRLGATEVFSYHDPSAAAESLISLLQDKPLVGALAINKGGVALSAQVIAAVPDSVKFIADVGPPHKEEYPPEEGDKGIRTSFYIPNDLHEPESVTCRVWRDWLPRALEEGRFVPEPEPLVVGKGLAKVHDAFQRYLQGVSAQKVVVEL